MTSQDMWKEWASETARRTNLWGIDWPGHPEGTAKTELEISLRDQPERWALVSLTSDPDADYSYDDLALMSRDDGVLCLLQTSGCSCPSPTETWGEVASGTLADIKAAVTREGKSWGAMSSLRGPWIEMGTFLESWVGIR